MKCQGVFVFKSLKYRSGGTFKDDKGVNVKYPSVYILKVDELMENGDINERIFKIDEKKTVLINDLKDLEAYQKIILYFNVTIYTSRISLELVDVNNSDIDD